MGIKKLPILKRLGQCMLVLLLWAFWPAGTRAQKQSSLEYKVKAAFLFHFTQFIEWPDNTFRSPSQPFVIGVLGQDPFGDCLEKAVENETVKGRPIHVRRYENAQDALEANILFIGYSKTGAFKEIQSLFVQRSILTVSDLPSFMKEGGMIRFFVEDGKIKIQINQQAYKREGLNISSKLLRLADMW